MLRIKRYSNRKLYDSATRRYVTLEEIADAIRRGDDLQVTDHTSGADLTTQVMLQAFFAAENAAEACFRPACSPACCNPVNAVWRIFARLPV